MRVVNLTALCGGCQQRLRHFEHRRHPPQANAQPLQKSGQTRALFPRDLMRAGTVAL